MFKTFVIFLQKNKLRGVELSKLTLIIKNKIKYIVIYKGISYKNRYLEFS